MPKIFLFVLIFFLYACKSPEKRTPPSTVSPELFSLSGSLTDFNCEAVAPGLIQLQERQAQEGFAEEEKSRWILTDKETPQGVVVLMHGLNLRPSRMDFVGEMLAAHGLDVFRGALTAHDGSRAQMKTVTRAHWLRDSAESYCFARQRALELQVPLLFVGFSLGSLAMLDLMVSTPSESVTFERMLLFAPPIAQHWFSGLIQVLRPFPTLFIPSANLPTYRASGSTSVSAYLALRSLSKSFAGGAHARLDVPTLVLMDPRDELVNIKGLRSFLKEKDLKGWTVVPVSNEESQLKRKYHHLIIDSVVVGDDEWRRMEKLALEHLDLL